MTPPTMTPQELRAWMERMGYSQRSLAPVLGVDHMTISRWERGVHRISPVVVYALRWIEEHPEVRT